MRLLSSTSAINVLVERTPQTLLRARERKRGVERRGEERREAAIIPEKIGSSAVDECDGVDR